MEKLCDVILVTFFDDVMKMMPLKWRHYWFFEVRFRHNQCLKNHNFTKSHNLRSPKSKI